MTTPLVKQIVSQSHELPEDSLVKSAQQAVTRERSKALVDRTERIKEMAPCKTKRALNLAAEKGSSTWLTVLPLKDLAPVPGKPISANRGLNHLNPGIKFNPRLVSVPESPISTIQGIN